MKIDIENHLFIGSYNPTFPIIPMICTNMYMMDEVGLEKVYINQVEEEQYCNPKSTLGCQFLNRP